jgi:transcriptional regulator with XRE-family HTH domain
MSRLRDERLRKNWSLTKVTQITGIPTSNLSMVERGLSPVWPSWRRRLSRAYGLSVDDLFGGGE